jgi:hypothetical protein
MHGQRRAVEKSARAASIYTTRRFSDHAPLTIDYDFAFDAPARKVKK